MRVNASHLVPSELLSIAVLPSVSLEDCARRSGSTTKGKRAACTAAAARRSVSRVPSQELAMGNRLPSASIAVALPYSTTRIRRGSAKRSGP
jgi:hypothetical protein